MDRFEQFIEEYKRDIEKDLAKRIQFIQDQVLGQNLQGAIVGISGGIDSAVAAALCVKALGKERVLGVWMPAYSLEVHGEDSKRLAEAIGLNLVTVDLGETYSYLIKEIEQIVPLSDKSKGNTKARLRMTTIYGIANQMGYLVSDTSNASEIYVGYITKGGDGVADFNPVASLTKTQIRILAEHLGIPASIIRKPPSADLWEHQTDEDEMGFTYEELDRYLITGKTTAKAQERIEYLHRISEHKRRLIPGI